MWPPDAIAWRSFSVPLYITLVSCTVFVGQFPMNQFDSLLYALQVIFSEPLDRQMSICSSSEETTSVSEQGMTTPNYLPHVLQNISIHWSVGDITSLPPLSSLFQLQLVSCDNSWQHSLLDFS